MLTGDKLETAENIGESCKLLVPSEMEIRRLATPEDVEAFCTDKEVEKNKQRILERKKLGLLVEANALNKI